MFNKTKKTALLIFSMLIAFSAANFAQDTTLQSFKEKSPLHLVDIGDVKLAVREYKGEGIPVLFIHGSWDDHNSWMRVAQRIVDSVNNPVILFDRRGHSASKLENKKQGSVTEDAEDAYRLIKAMGYSKAYIAGHSYGASVAIKLASVHPEIVENVILYEPPLFALIKQYPQYLPALKEVKEGMVLAKSLLEKGEIEKGTIAFVEMVAFGKGSWQNLFDERARCTMTLNYDTWLDQSNDPERLNTDPEALAIFGSRVALIYGKKSLPVYPAIIKEISRILPDATVTAVENAGHGGIISESERVAKVILENIKKHQTNRK